MRRFPELNEVTGLSVDADVGVAASGERAGGPSGCGCRDGRLECIGEHCLEIGHDALHGLFGVLGHPLRRIGTANLSEALKALNVKSRWSD